MRKLLFFVWMCTMTNAVLSQAIPYGSNPAAGRYLSVEGDAKLYYEVYGEGSPLLLLHGDALGYIDEFDQYIPILSKYFRVIAVGMRGHGRSELGTRPFSYALFAADALAVLRKETNDSATVVGFSAGAITAYYLAAYYPGSVRKVVAMGGALDKDAYRPGALTELNKLTLAELEKELPDLIASRKKIMPQPERYPELLEKLKTSWNEDVYIDLQKAKGIKCPVLSVGGDRDHYFDAAQFVNILKVIPGSQLAIVPNCGHVGLITRPDMFTALILPFLINQK
jgi:pimeloyl-ACP methyl ester carboxylesterase